MYHSLTPENFIIAEVNFDLQERHIELIILAIRHQQGESLASPAENKTLPSQRKNISSVRNYGAPYCLVSC